MNAPATRRLRAAGPHNKNKINCCAACAILHGHFFDAGTRIGAKRSPNHGARVASDGYHKKASSIATIEPKDLNVTAELVVVF